MDEGGRVALFKMRLWIAMPEFGRGETGKCFFDMGLRLLRSRRVAVVLGRAGEWAG